ncbi:dipeptide epimerase [Chryseomicrobium sp. FSL W7-1435]|uniref:mandelate racemase/muconate lactonizing enzyme family protein n=1 Tax=Chryseomicrobium sp. FSL W7-1435 TaxID=2921704 RepID=UPI00315ACBD2
MKITQVDVYAIRLPLITPFIVSYHSYPDMPSIIVKLTTDEGIVGYGEAVADDHVTGESWESTFALIQHSLGPAVIGHNPMHMEALHDKMDAIVYQAPAAKAAIDIACYDAVGKKLGVPVYDLLGGRFHERFPITHVLSIGEPEQMAEEARERVEQGYESFKMKVGRDVLSDVARIRAVREAVGPNLAIRVDVNQGWGNAATTLQAIELMKGLNIDWLEQPVKADDLDGMVEIKAKSMIPLMVDEGLKYKREMREIIQKGAAHKANIKLMKCGGIYPATKLAHMAEMAGIDCQIGSMVESSVGSAAGFHVAFAKKIFSSVELTGPLKFSKDIGNLHYDVPFIALNDQAGLGVDVDETVLAELTVRHETLKEGLSL